MKEQNIIQLLLHVNKLPKPNNNRRTVEKELNGELEGPTTDREEDSRCDPADLR